MTISWYGEACFLFESGGTRVLIEPPQKESGITPPRLKSDIIIKSKNTSPIPAESDTFVIDGPGEYEINGVNILGIADGANTIYNIEMDDIKIAHFGFLNNDLNNEQLVLINEPDIAMVPVGNGNVLSAEAAMKLINKIEPSIAIPMLYEIKELATKRASLSEFLKESEAKEPPQAKLTIKKKDLVPDQMKITILEKV